MKELIIFSSTTCAPCRALKPVLEEVAAQHEIPVRYVDMCQSNQSQFQEHGVRAVPTIVFMRDGHEAGKLVGAQTRASIERLISSWSAR